MTFGEPGKDGARVHNIKDVEAILDVFKHHGHTEVSYATNKLTLFKRFVRRLIPLEPMPAELASSTLAKSIFLAKDSR